MITSASAFAYDPTVCDPSTDSNECHCPNSGVDACTETDPGDLLDASDATDLADYVTASYDGHTGIWDVTIDVHDLPGGAVTLGSSAGHWDDIDDLYSYLSTLFGTTVSVPTTSTTISMLPDMHITQIGTTSRLDATNDEWASANSHNMILDLITDADGKIYFGTTGIQLFGNDCSGTDSHSYCTNADGDLKVEACSYANHSVTTNFHDANCAQNPEPCTVILNEAQTTMQTADTLWFGDTLHCVKGSSSYVCDMVNGWFTKVRVEADELYLQNEFYNQGYYDNTQTVDETDKMETSNVEFGQYGVCSKGITDDGSYEADTPTRDGDYDSGRTACGYSC